MSVIWKMGFREAWLKLIKLREAHNELAHRIWAKSTQWFIWKCKETAQTIRCQEMTGIQWNMTKSWSGQEGPAQQVRTKSDQQFVCKCTEIGKKNEARVWLEISEAWSKFRHGEAHNELAHQIWAQPDKQFVWNARELLDKSENGKRREFSGAWPKVNQGRPLMSLLTIESTICGLHKKTPGQTRAPKTTGIQLSVTQS